MSLEISSLFWISLEPKSDGPLAGHTKAIGDGPRNLEPRSSNEDDICAVPPSPNYHTYGKTSSFNRF
ncbi:hypothetical protein TNCV_4550531 [Trichonephila clavipes]|nr:hypothetical protein TNCV_4550531 [Trichonephila clavipes]